MARTHRAPYGGSASTGAVAQNGGSLPIYICNTCDREVVWATSAQTGRKYLVNVSRGHLGQRLYIGSNIHRERAVPVVPAPVAREMLGDLGDQIASVLADPTYEPSDYSMGRLYIAAQGTLRDIDPVLYAVWGDFQQSHDGWDGEPSYGLPALMDWAMQHAGRSAAPLPR